MIAKLKLNKETLVGPISGCGTSADVGMETWNASCCPGRCISVKP